MDFSFLQTAVSNPFALIAAVSGILGVGFKVVINKIKEPKPGFILAMYGLFVVTILALALGGLAMVLLLSGRGATDEVAKTQWQAPFSLITTAYAHDGEDHRLPGGHIPTDKVTNDPLPGMTGWLWAGETEAFLPNRDAENQLAMTRLNISRTPSHEALVTTTKKTNLRDAPPKFSWFRFRYVLGTKLIIMPPEQKLRVLEKKYAGSQVWLRVEIVNENTPLPHLETDLQTDENQ